MSVLVILEQQGGQWHRMSWETLAAGQQFAAALGQSVEAAVVGKGIAGLAAEAASKKLAKVWAVEHDVLDAYTPDGYAAALEELIKKAAPTLVLFPHTYQTRDFAPKLATRFSQVLISDAIAARSESGGLTFVRQFFQGKLNGDVRASGAGPQFVSLQAGAWRADVLKSHGGFSGDTVAEDTDLTLTIRREGWKILYDEDAIGRTEVPETVEALIRQRFRWTFGTLQAVWKHRDAVGKPRYGTLGWVAIPNIFLFQILLPLVSPVIDLLFLLSIALWGLAQLRIARLPQLWTSQDVERSLIFFAIFMMIDLLTCVVAFALEKNEDWSLLAPLILQRFYYRQMMYVVLFRALREAVRGRPVGWRGVEPQMPAPVTQA